MRRITSPAAIYVQTNSQTERLEQALASAESVAVDCEAAGFHRYSDRLCLVQLSTPDETFVIDPFAIPAAKYLKPYFEDPARTVIMHGAAYDLRLLCRDLGTRVGTLVDTQVAASFLGEPAISLQALLAKHLGVSVSKRYQKADWARRPLPREMIEYAAGDTRYLHRLAAVLQGGLAACGRSGWAEEEYRWLVRAADAADVADDPDPVARMKGAKKLEPRALAALRGALEWRDRIACDLDRAPFRIVSDAALLEVVAVWPGSPGQLAGVKGFPPRLAKTRGRALLDILRRVKRMRANMLPPPPVRKRGLRPSPEAEAAFDRLKAVRNRCAGEHGLERGRVMANHVLREVASADPGSRAELEAVAGVRRWQTEVLGDALLAALGEGAVGGA